MADTRLTVATRFVRKALGFGGVLRLTVLSSRKVLPRKRAAKACLLAHRGLRTAHRGTRSLCLLELV